jgi:antitoxin (DNA-binding transcriptional repressor) of toxin-antitoxin stability system
LYPALTPSPSNVVAINASVTPMRPAGLVATVNESWAKADHPSLAFYDQSWSYIVMKQVGIAELKSRLSEFLRVVQGGESIAVLDRNRAVAHIVPILERSGLRIRKPATDSPKPNKVSLPKSIAQKIDVVELLLEERQSHR